MRAGRLILMLKGAFADRLVAATAFLVVLLAATLLAAIPIYSHAVAESSLRERLGDAPPTAVNLQATVSVFGASDDPALESRVGDVAHSVFAATGVSVFGSAESEPFATGRTTLVLAFFDGIANHARLTGGRWPASRRSPVEAAVPEAVARALELDVGDVIRARSRLDEGRKLAVRVVGIFSPQKPSSVYWWGNPLTSSGGAGPFVTTKQSFFALGFEDVERRWRLEPQLDRLTIDQAAVVRRRLSSLPTRLNARQPEGQQFTIDTNLPEILSGASRSLRLARAGVLVPSIQLALLAAYGLVLTAALLIEQRRKTIESLRLRGATKRQIVTTAALEASLIAVPAVALAPWLAAGTLRTLNYVGPLADIGLRLEPHVNLAAYSLAAGAGAVCVAGLVLPAVFARRLSVAGDRQVRSSFVQRARLDLVLAVLAVLGYWQLRRYHSVLVSNRAGLDIDPFLVAAPALLLLAGALLSLRLVPIAAALVERVLPSTHGPVGALGFWQLARRPRAYARSVLLLVLAVAIGIFAATYSRTWHRSQIDQSQHAAGSDVVAEPTDAPGTPRAIELSSAYRALGAEDALPAATYEFDLGRFASESGNLLALDARRAATVVGVRDDFADASLPQLFGHLERARAELASLPLPGRPVRLGISVDVDGRRGGPVVAPTGFGGQPPASPPSVFLYLRDDDGVVYLYRLGEVTFGREERFEVELARRLSSGRLSRPRYPLSVVGLELDLDVPYVVPGRVSFALRSLELLPTTEGRWRRVRLGGPSWRATTSPFPLPYRLPHVERVAVGRAVRAVFTTGSYLYAASRQATTEVTLRPGRDSLPSALPVLASDSYLAATDARVGETVPLALASGTQTVRISGSFRRFPTLDPGVPAIVADLGSYAAMSFAAHGDVIRPSSWWLKAQDDVELARRLRAPPFRSLDVVSRSERERALLEDPVPLGVIGALALGFVVAAAFAAVGFAASAAAAARARMLEFAVVRSLGLRTRELSAWITLENALVVGLSLAGGTALGLLVSWLVLPYVALGTSTAQPVPPVRVYVPWGLVLWLEGALLAALVAISAVQVLRVRGLRLAPVLRGGEGALTP